MKLGEWQKENKVPLAVIKSILELLDSTGKTKTARISLASATAIFSPLESTGRDSPHHSNMARHPEFHCSQERHSSCDSGGTCGEMLFID
jgi:hypothetical protein